MVVTKITNITPSSVAASQSSVRKMRLAAAANRQPPTKYARAIRAGYHCGMIDATPSVIVMCSAANAASGAAKKNRAEHDELVEPARVRHASPRERDSEEQNGETAGPGPDDVRTHAVTIGAAGHGS